MSVMELRKNFENNNDNLKFERRYNNQQNQSATQGLEYEQVEAISKHLLSLTEHRPKIGIICGSGLGGIADKLDEQDVILYKDIPNFPVSTVQGHSGCLIFGKLNNVTVLCMKGRIHPFEGYPIWKCTLPVRVMKLIGIETLIVTNAGGGLNTNYRPGDVMIIKDHINFVGLSGEHPLKGKNDDRWGERFPSMNDAYDRHLIKLTKQCVSELEMDSFIQEGVYAMVCGPTYETVAEAHMLRKLGGDSVGMSTVHEVTVAHHCGMKVLGFSLITNMCVDKYDDDSTPNHEDVIQMSNRRAQDLERLVSLVLKELNSTETEPNHNANDHHSIEQPRIKVSEEEVDYNESSHTNGNESDDLNEVSNSLITE